MKRLPPLHCLQAIEAVARLGSIVAAAEELCVTASAVSHRVRQLEYWLGQSLVARTKPLALTAYASQYAIAAREALAGIAALPQPRTAEKLQLHIAVPPTFGRNILVPRLSGFTRANPHIEIELHLTIPLLDIKAADADLEVRWGGGAYADTDDIELLLNEPAFAVAAPSYLQRANSLRHPRDLKDANLLRSPLEPWRPWFAAAGLDWPEPSGGVQFNDVGLLMESTVAGQGVALARRTIAERWLNSGELLPIFDVQAKSPHGYWLLYDRATLKRAEARLFVDWLRAAVRTPLDMVAENNSASG